MNPYKAKDLLPDLAQKEGIPLELANDLTDAFWNHTRKCLSSLDYYRIMILHLGSFHIKGDRKLTMDINKLNTYNYKKRIDPPKTKKNLIMFEYTEEKLRKLIMLRDQYYREYQEKKENKQLRKHVRAQRDLEAQETNP